MVPPFICFMKITFLFSLLLFTTAIFAGNESIIIKQKSGNETVLELSTNPVITFEGEDMVITNSFTTISFPIMDIDGYTVSSSSSGIEEVPDMPHYQNGHVILNQVPKGASVFVYDIDGKIVNRLYSNKTGQAVVSLDNISKGVYVISAPNQSIKVFNK